MIKKEVTYENPFTEEEVNQTLYFNINLAEATRMEMFDDLSGRIREIGELDSENEEHKRKTYEFFEWIVSAAYGNKSEDGINFVKEEAVTNRFMTSEAYSALLKNLLMEENSTENASKFINGLFTKDIMEHAQKLAAEEEKKQKKAGLSIVDQKLAESEDN